MGKESELVDLVDDLGKIKVIAVPRNKINDYPNLYLQIGIAVIFDDSGKILVQKRALTKDTCPGDLDHTCGVLKTGETPEQGMYRETREETGLIPQNLKIIDQGLNIYRRYRYLMIGKASGKPNSYDLKEIEWVKFISVEDLESGQKSGKFTFVKDFFEDLETALDKSN